MRVRLMGCVAVLTMAAVVMVGCVGKRQTRDDDGGTVPAVATLQSPMVTATQALHELQTAVKAGNDQAVRGSYDAFAAAFGEMLAPISHADTKAAQAMANANTALQAAVSGKQVDGYRAAREAEAILIELTRTAATAGLSIRSGSTLPAGAPGSGVRVIEVRGKEYRFEPAAIQVSKGERVTVRFTNAGTEKHEFELEALDQEIEPIAPGTTAELTFTVEESGTFEYACHVEDHYEQGMRGQLIVR